MRTAPTIRVCLEFYQTDSHVFFLRRKWSDVQDEPTMDDIVVQTILITMVWCFIFCIGTVFVQYQSDARYRPQQCTRHVHNCLSHVSVIYCNHVQWSLCTDKNISSTYKTGWRCLRKINYYCSNRSRDGQFSGALFAGTRRN